MKTTKLISAISFALILATATSVFSAIPEKSANREEKANLITFNVNVHLTSDLAFCGLYQVKLVFADGSLVAAPQTFIAGKSSYVFSTLLWPGNVRPLYIWKTRITALLVPVSPIDIVCPVDLITNPDSKTVLWTTGQNISFNLFPNTTTRKNISQDRATKE
jgi:hypothetical protein